MRVPKNPRYAIKQAGMLGTVGNQIKRVGQYGKDLVMPGGKFNPIKGVAEQAKKGYRMTATATSPDKQKRLVSDTLENALGGKASNFATIQNPNKGGIIQSLRNRGWLSAGGKTTGNYSPEQIKKIKEIMKRRGLMRDTSKSSFLGKLNSPVNEKAKLQDMQAALKEIQAIKPAKGATRMQRVGDKLYAIAPGEKTLLVGGAGLGVGGELASKETEQGRKKSLAERIGRGATVGVAEAALAPLGLARKFGLAGMAAEGIGQEAVYQGMTAADKKLGGPNMKKQAGSFDDLNMLQRAAVARRAESGISSFDGNPDHKVSFTDSINPLKIRDNYRKHVAAHNARYDALADQMFPKQAHIPARPRLALRRSIK